MAKFLFSLVRSIRPRQALKNLSLFTPLIFTGQLFVGGQFWEAFFATIIFTILTSSVYLINDVFDLQADRQHPIKKNRPIASGEIPVAAALFLGICGFTLSLFLAINLNFFFFLAELTYLILQVAYTLRLKKIIIIDVLAIASGFIIRVYAGAFAINTHMNVWFLLCVVSLSLFLAVGKRRAELKIVGSQEEPSSRKTLGEYNLKLLDSYLAVFANSALLSYALFTFFAPPPVVSSGSFLATILPQTLAGINKWLMATIPFVIYGVMRYMNVIYTGSKAEAPERVLLTDKPLLAVVGVWAVSVIFILYGLPS
jgi:4-hydroxybenzoate polyprenyltransferase